MTDGKATQFFPAHGTAATAATAATVATAATAATTVTAATAATATTATTATAATAATSIALASTLINSTATTASATTTRWLTLSQEQANNPQLAKWTSEDACVVCGDDVGDDDEGTGCESCERWYHNACLGDEVPARSVRMWECGLCHLCGRCHLNRHGQAGELDAERNRWLHTSC